MQRQTSIDAYRELVIEGVLSEKNKIVYKYLYEFGPKTQKQAEVYFGDVTYTIRPRFAQLVKMGLIKHADYDVCEKTGHRNMTWDVTDMVTPKVIEKIKDPTIKQWKAAVAIADKALTFLSIRKDLNQPNVRDFIFRAIDKMKAELE